MKKIHVFGIVGLVFVLGVALTAALLMGEKQPFLASGRVSIDESLVEQAKNAKALFIVVYNENSPMPMPFGALRLKTNVKNKDWSQSFMLNEHTIQKMIPDAPDPSKMRIKVRLDMDGVAGPDRPGDLTGSVSGVAPLTKKLNIPITTRI